MMRRRVLLSILRALGGFRLARRLTVSGLRILCYHGVALGDEHRFRPGLFIRPDQLERRLKYLIEARFPVLPLDEALQRLRRGDLPPCSTVLTFDDGFYGVLAAGLPRLQKYTLPATLYLSTYYVQNQRAVYNLAVPYLLWRCTASVVDLSNVPLPDGLAKRHDWERMDPAERQNVVDALVAHGESCTGDERDAILSHITAAVGLAPREFLAQRRFAFLDPAEVKRLHGAGIMIELHTHRHRSPADQRLAELELIENQAVVERLTGRRSRHFCYPSGRDELWSRDLLTDLGIESATTTQSGFNYAHTPPLGLRRFLDAADISQLEFEAEMCGVLEIARRLRDLASGIVGMLSPRLSKRDGTPNRPSPSRRSLVQRSLFLTLLLTSLTSARAQEVPIPELSRWEHRMMQYGRKHCEWHADRNHSFDERLAHTYYDEIRVMHQIADYTHDASWRDCAVAARNVYRDNYVLPNKGGIPGYWNFTDGLRLDYLRTTDAVSRASVLSLADRAAYASDSAPPEQTKNIDRSREVAYALLSYINAEALGAPRRSRRAILVSQAYDHLDQWFLRFAWRGSTSQFSPFMVGLTAHSLIRDWEETRDPRLIPALRRAADWLWQNAWVARDESMLYQINPANISEGGRSTNGAPDLNLLIAPMYAFLAKYTGASAYREQADLLFKGGVRGAFLESPKQFNQNYWWSFDYVKWRSP